MSHRLAVFATLLSLGTICVGRSLAPVQYDHVSSASDVIAVVVMDSARQIRGTHGTLCGNEYVAIVETVIKGTQVRESLTFKAPIGRIVGSRYLVFLSRAGSPLDLTFLPFAGLQPHPDEVKWRQDCESFFPVLRESYDGLATLAVEPGEKFGWRPSVRLFSPRQQIPKGLAYKPEANALKVEDGVIGPVQIELELFIQKLRQFAHAPK